MSARAQAWLATAVSPTVLSPADLDAARAAHGERTTVLFQRLGAGRLAPVIRELREGVTTFRLEPLDLQDGTSMATVYVHGGAFVLGQACDQLAATLPLALGGPVVSVEYSRAPEAAFPVALEECVRVLRSIGADYESFVVVGSSAGGALAIAAVSRLQREGGRLPDRLGLISPWADLAPDGDSLEANAGRDPIIQWSGQLDFAARAYLGAAPMGNPEASPLLASYDSDFPPTMIVTGTRDLFLSLCVRLYWVLREGDVEAHLRVWEGMWHTFALQAELPEAQAALAELARFLQARPLPR